MRLILQWHCVYEFPKHLVLLHILTKCVLWLWILVWLEIHATHNIECILFNLGRNLIPPLYLWKLIFLFIFLLGLHFFIFIFHVHLAPNFLKHGQINKQLQATFPTFLKTTFRNKQASIILAQNINNLIIIPLFARLSFFGFLLWSSYLSTRVSSVQVSSYEHNSYPNCYISLKACFHVSTLKG